MVRDTWEVRYSSEQLGVAEHEYARIGYVQ
jgi:hypothetical protein